MIHLFWILSYLFVALVMLACAIRYAKYTVQTIRAHDTKSAIVNAIIFLVAVVFIIFANHFGFFLDEVREFAAFCQQ